MAKKSISVSCLIPTLEVAEAWGGVWICAGWDFGGAGGGGLIHGFFDGAAYEVARAEADGEGEREDDASEEDAEGQFYDGAANLEVVEGHGGGEDQD